MTSRTHAKRKAPTPQLRTQAARKRVRPSRKSPVGEQVGHRLDSDSDMDSVADVPNRHGAKGKRQQQLGQLTRECDVCMASHKPSHFPTPEDLPADCSHCTNTCKACISASLASAIENRPFDEAGCPRCKASWDRYYIESYSTEEVMLRYETMGMLRLVQAMPTFIWCLSPTCDSGQIHQDGDEAPIVTCAACGFKMCFTHQVAWHPEITCADYEAYRDAESANADFRTRLAQEEEKTAAALAKSTKPCPKCGAKIQKDGGCEHMTCKSDRLSTPLEHRPLPNSV